MREALAFARAGTAESRPCGSADAGWDEVEAGADVSSLNHTATWGRAAMPPANARLPSSDARRRPRCGASAAAPRPRSWLALRWWMEELLDRALPPQERATSIWSRAAGVRAGSGLRAAAGRRASRGELCARARDRPMAAATIATAGVMGRRAGMRPDGSGESGL
jgi:hypothetical protein